MPRPARIYEKTGKPFRKDMELVKGAQAGDQACYQELWEKFYLLRQKTKFSFLNWCKSNNIDSTTTQDYFDGWDADAWEKFVEQMPGIRVAELEAKGYNNDNWGITIRLMGYWQTINRSYANKIMKKLKSEVSSSKVVSDQKNKKKIVDVFDSIPVQENPMRSIALDIFNKSYDKMIRELTPIQKKVIELKKDRMSVSAIVKELGLKRSEATSAIAAAKSALSRNIRDASSKVGAPMTYEDVLTYLQ